MKSFILINGETKGNNMLNKVDEHKYIDYMFARLPDVQRGGAHKLKKGESLWGLAKKELNNPKASNSEISEYMLLIAKLNKLDTIEKMNGLKVNDEIYLPSVQSGNAAVKTSKTLTDAEQTLADIKETLLNDKTLHVTQASPKSIRMYHVYNHCTNEKTGYTTQYHPVISFTLDKNGKFKDASFEGKNNINSFGYDYDFGSDGEIKQHGVFRRIKHGQIDRQDMDVLKTRLEELSQKAVSAY